MVSLIANVIKVWLPHTLKICAIIPSNPDMTRSSNLNNFAEGRNILLLVRKFPLTKVGPGLVFFIIFFSHHFHQSPIITKCQLTILTAAAHNEKCQIFAKYALIYRDSAVA